MNLGGGLPPANIEDLRNLRMQARQRNTVTQEPIGRDQQGHEIEVAPSNPRPTQGSGAASSHVEASEVSQVSTTPEQAVQDVAQGIEETTQLAKELANLFKTAPTMACLRILDFSEMHGETAKLFEANQGAAEAANKKLILNNGQPPVRIAVPIPGSPDKWTSVVPSIIPAGITARFPDEHGNWIEMQAPNRKPNSDENKQVRDLIQGALTSHYGASEAGRMFSSYQGEIKVADVGNMMAEKPEGNPNNDLVNLVTIREGKEDSLQQARQELTSPYVPLLEGISAAAEFVARGAGAVVGTVGVSLAGFADGAMQGGQAVEKALDKAPLIVSTGPIAAVPVMAGIFLGGVTGPIRALPQAAKTFFNYFLPQQAWKKSISALSRWSNPGHAVGLLQKANEADEKIKTDIKTFLQPFIGDAKYQKIQGILIGQIDEKTAERTAVMQQLNRKIKEQNENAIPTSGPIGTKRSARVRL